MLQPQINGHPRAIVGAPTARFRQCGESDVPWLMEMARHHYGPAMADPQGVLLWIRSVLTHPQCLAYRAEEAVVVAMAGRTFFDPSASQARVLFFAGEVWEVVSLLRIAAHWARRVHGMPLWFTDDTGRDIAVLARRLKAKAVPPTPPAYLIGG